MPHPRSFATVAAILGLLAVVVPPVHAQVIETESPLVLTIDSLTPGAIPVSGAIRVSGTVTNASDDIWTGVKVRPFISDAPMTTTADLSAAASVPETAEVGTRILSDETSETIDELAPGQTAAYALTISRKQLRLQLGGPPSEGVYWFGVHAMDGQDAFADGRARTFLPYLKDTTTPVRAALIMPLRAHVTRAPDGTLSDLDRWIHLLGGDGRLGRLLAVGDAVPFGQRPTWLVDPSVLDAVQQLADGNPPRYLGSTKAPADTPTESSSPSGSSSPTEEPTPSEETTELAELASAWLPRMIELLRSSEVLGLPYGDLDLTATAHHGRSLYGPAHARSAAAFEALGISAAQADAPAAGVVDAVSLSLPSPGTPILVSDRALPETPDGPGPVVADADGARLIVASSAALEGGPGPGDRQAVVPLRQRLLAEAAVRALDPSRPPLVVRLGATWAPADPAEFASGLQAPLFDLAGLSTATAAQTGPAISRTALRYSSADEESELPAARYTTATGLMEAGQTLQKVLTDNDQVAAELGDEALTGLSFLSRGERADPSVMTSRWVSEQLSQVRVQAPPSVTLSSDSGHFPATVENRLDQPVTVKLAPSSDSRLSVTTPDKIELPASGQTTVLLGASAARAGVHNVRLEVTDTDGTPLGSSVVVPVRAAHVSGIIWLFIAVGAGLLFGAIGVRLVRRARASGAPEPEDPDSEPSDSEAPVS